MCREYEKITYTYATEAAKAFATIPPSDTRPFKFVFVSGEGATTTPGFTTANFGVVKGRVEAALLALAKEHPKTFAPYSCRLAMPDPKGYEEIQPYLPKRSGMIKVMETVAGPLVRTLSSSMVLPLKQGSSAFVKLAMGDGKPLQGKGVTGEGRTLNNARLRQLAGL